MHLRALLRSSAALPVLPFAVIISIVYYFLDGRPQIHFAPIPTAPMLVNQSTGIIYPFAYAVVAAVAAWQGARTRADGVWEAGPHRRRWTVIAVALSPVVAVAWLMFLLPVTAAFIERPTIPTWDSLPPLFLGLALSVGWALIGFTFGHRVNPVIAVPLLACGIFYLVSYTYGRDQFFWRHMSGEYYQSLGFGEAATLESMAAQFLPTASIAVAVALLWGNLPRIAAIVAGGLVIVASTFSSYTIVKGWDHNPSIRTGNVAQACVGTAPRICVPEQARKELPEIQKSVGAVYSVLTAYGVVNEVPDTVRDRSSYGRFDPPPVEGTRYVPLLRGRKTGSVVGPMLVDEVRFGCDADGLSYRVVHLWLGEKLGITRTFESYTGEDPYYTREQHRHLMQTVGAVSAKPDAAQKAWFQRVKTKACEEAE